MKKVKSLLIATTLLACMIPNVVYASSTGYKNKYTDYVSVPGEDDFTAMEGMCLDRDNNVIYTVKLNNTTHLARLYCINMGNSPKPVPMKCNGKFSYDLGHANDLTVAHENGKTYIYVAPAPTDDIKTKYANKIVKLEVNGDTFSIAGEYDAPINASGITYSVGTGKFIIKSGKQYLIGTFNNTKFNTEKTFKLIHNNEERDEQKN